MSSREETPAGRPQLSPAKLAILQRRLRGELPGTKALPSIPRRAEGGTAPLLFAQQRLWFLDQLQPDSSAYNLPSPVRFSGELRVEALERTLNEIVRRHEALRTTFQLVDGVPAQLIAEPRHIALPLIDLSAEPEPERRARELAAADARRAFDLVRGPLLRASLLRLAADEHLLLFTIHHIVSDGWSAGVLVREVAALYEAFSRDEPSPLPELAVQYADYAVWQREWLQGEALETQLSYWRKQLGGYPQPLSLPADRARSSAQSREAGNVSLPLSPELVSRLRELSRREGCTLFMTLLAGFQLLLARYTGQEDVVVGTPTAGRVRPELEPLIGFFINTLALRTDLGGNPSFAELMARAKQVALGAQAHQEVPFERVVEELRTGHGGADQPFFDVMFALQNAPTDLLRLEGLTLSAPPAENREAKFDLSVSAVELPGGGLRLACEYAAALYEEATARRLLGHYARLLEGAAEDPSAAAWDLPLMSEEERRRVVSEWNRTRREYERGVTLHGLFERQAAATPDAVALVYEDERLTYRELNVRANRLARHLQRLGVGTDAVVGILLERSTEMIVSLFAVLKAGGAYMPLDPEYPADRLGMMLEDSGASVLLTSVELRGRLESLSPGRELRVVVPDAESEAVAALDGGELGVAVAPENLAYVIYTSGSTGRPKGVMSQHLGICNRLFWMQEAYRLDASDSVMQKTTYSFDVSVWEFFWPLMTGARLVVARPGGHRDGAYLAGLIERERVTTMHFVPSMLQVFLREPGLRERCRSLRRVVCSGEALPVDLQERFFETLDTELHNLYGPTEASVDVSFWECRKGSEHRSVPIGRPIANTQLYVLERGGRPSPTGAAGELHIGGVGLARGYLGRPALTAEKFVPDPFSADPGARLYRTGDLARHLADGQIEFLGRIDHQVKVRGFRIELGEIEAVLAEHASVEEALVLAREFGGGDKRLVAYVVAAAGSAVAAGELREHLRGRLPDYMLPSAFVMLDSLPLTPNGKLDRRALPEPEQARAEGVHLAPRTPTEEMLCAVFAQVLGVEQVGVEESFFELGGHSLLATQVISRVREAFGVELALREFFKRPTVEGLAAAVDEALRAGTGGSAAPPLTQVERNGGGLPLSFAQQRLWFLDQLEPGNASYNIPLAVKLTGTLNVGALSRTLDEIVRRHEVLRTSFRAEEGRPVQIISEARGARLAVVELDGLTAEERERAARRLASEEARRPFDLSAAPLLRARLLKLSDEEHVVLFTMHHIVSDGWSLGVLVNEVAALYEAFSRGEESPLPELPIQYADYAAWQRGWLRGEALEAQLSYWRKHLGGDLALLDLPTDRPRPAVRSHRGASESVVLPAELARGLKTLSLERGCTLFMTLLAAFKTLLHHLSGQTDISVGTDIANRNRAETERLIGFFVNQLVVRTRLSGEPTFLELLDRVREACLGAYAHQDVPFEKLVEAVNPVRDASRTPLFEAKMVLQNAPAGELELPGLTLSPWQTATGTAKFDLLLNLSESERGLGASLEYNSDLFEADTARRVLGRFRTLLEEVVARPGARLPELLASLAEEDRRERAGREKELEGVRLRTLKSIKRRSAGASRAEGE